MTGGHLGGVSWGGSGGDIGRKFLMLSACQGCSLKAHCLASVGSLPLSVVPKQVKKDLSSSRAEYLMQTSHTHHILSHFTVQCQVSEVAHNNNIEEYSGLTLLLREATV